MKESVKRAWIRKRKNKSEKKKERKKKRPGSINSNILYHRVHLVPGLLRLLFIPHILALPVCVCSGLFPSN